MAGASLEETPTWIVAVVCVTTATISVVIEYIIHLIGKWLKSRHKKAIYNILEKIKSELVLPGIISLLLTVGQRPISDICISTKVGAKMHPCSIHIVEPKYRSTGEEEHGRKLLSAGGARRRILAADEIDKCAAKGMVQFISAEGINQLQRFIFALAVSQLLYCSLTIALGRAKMRRWKAWEKEAVEYQFSHDPEKFRLARDTSFGRRHLSFWSKKPVPLWIAHLAPHSHTKFDFQNYIKRSLEKDFKVDVQIRPPFWFFTVLVLLVHTHGWYSYLWLPFIPLISILLVGTKLQVIITKMGLRIQERGEVVKGVPIVQPGDDLFWFNRPRLLLCLINIALFQNAFEMAFFAWVWYEFGLRSCFNEDLAGIIIIITIGVFVLILCSYVTLPLYALVTQMGSTVKPTIFNERVIASIRNWHHRAKKHKNQNKHSNLVTPVSSRPVTPTYGMSPVDHVSRSYRSEMDSLHTLPRRSDYDMENWENDGSSPSPPRLHQGAGGSSSHQQHRVALGNYVENDAEVVLPSSSQVVSVPQPTWV